MSQRIGTHVITSLLGLGGRQTGRYVDVEMCCDIVCRHCVRPLQDRRPRRSTHVSGVHVVNS
jgi:hypothetical protein